MDRLPTFAFLRRRGIVLGDDQGGCIRCGEGEETGDHLLFLCGFTQWVWEWFVGWWDVCLPLSSSLFGLLGASMQCLFSGDLVQWWSASVATMLWSLWLCRNEAVFNRKLLSFDEVCFLIKARSYYWVKVAAEFSNIDEAQWLLCPRLCATTSVQVRPRLGISWCPLYSGYFTFTSRVWGRAPE
ncbi:hypothetical protein V6N12_050578 [Hibiscus sabdariffa]|uniref:Reverse transcriptase zinc-binding domain-containing protein n=1 Tax=Hibiscus sabdariffa TaxID=183260 RepID=A0ABR2GCT5_9ROSI